MPRDNFIQHFLFNHLIDRLIELASILVPFKFSNACYLYLFILLCFEKVFIYNRHSDRLRWNMPDASFSSPLWWHGWRHWLNNAISARSFDYSHSLS